MRQALSVAMLHFRLTVKNKATLLMMFGLPLLMTLVFRVLVGGDGGDKKGHLYPVALADEDGSFASRKLTEALEREPTLTVRRVTADQMSRLFADRRIDSGVIIPAGFERAVTDGTAPELRLVVAAGGNLSVGVGPVVRRVATRVVQDYRLARELVATAANRAAPDAASHRGAEPDGVDEAKVAKAYARMRDGREAVGVAVKHERATRAGSRKRDPLAQVDRAALGFTVSFLMMVAFMMAGVILQERQQGTWGRLLTTPTPKAGLLAGYLLGFHLTGMFQFAVLTGASSLLFGVRWGPLPQLAVMATAMILCAAGMGLFLAGIVRTHEQQMALGVLFVNATSMLGGVYWPLDFVGETMRRIGYLTPQAWAIDGLREVMLRGGPWSALFWPVVVLLAAAAIFVTAGLLRVRYE